MLSVDCGLAFVRSTLIPFQIKLMRCLGVGRYEIWFRKEI